MKEFIVIIGSIPKGGIKPETVQEFREAARLLIDKGFNPLNSFYRNQELSRLVFDRVNFHNDQIIELSDEQYGSLLDSIYFDLRICDAVYLLDSYAEDPIGYALLAMAHALGRTIYRSDDFFAPYIDANTELPFTVRRTFQGRRLPNENISDDISELKRREIEILKKTNDGLDVYRLLWPDATRVIDAGDLSKPFKRRAELVGSCFFNLSNFGLVDSYFVMDFGAVDYPGCDCFEWVRREKGLPSRYQACLWIETTLKLHASGET